ncbi:nucleotide-diphospho-sugar transferase [Mucilaginibacter angelicae]|uniref:Nucleotide-diphospho-sugar transferase n=1 Tax=Mucilaginibacter angelicae TaxID=869718 RepID=A0ABV6L526_9SPHI
MLHTPVLFLIFNRPDTTGKVFQELRKQRPKHLYIAADGPRADHPDDERLCRECKGIVADIDWDCDIRTLFRTENLGCGAGPATAITWFFSQVDTGIILEDDCIPNPSFFRFCETMLIRYKDNPRIMMVCGTSYQPRPLNNNTYYFSKYPHAWGWATWKRAWQHYQFNLATENEATRQAVVNSTFSHARERKLWIHNLQHITKGLDAWDYQWMYWIWKNQGLCITPWRNMVSNIGFGPQATHTFDRSSAQAAMQQYEIDAIVHPEHLEIGRKADQYERFNILIDPNRKYFLNRCRAALKRIRRILLKK